MDLFWLDLYSRALDRFCEKLPRSRGVVVAFNTNIDGIINLTDRRLSSLAEKEPDLLKQAYERKDSPPGRIDTPVDFLAGLLHFFERGAGGEYMIYDPSVYDWIVSRLPIDEYRMGGNAGIMANALSRLGARFVIPHAVQLPERQAKLFLDEGRIRLPVIEGGELRFLPPSRVHRPDRELVHLIIEFKEGAVLDVGGRRIRAPRSNRFIANADDFNGRIVIDEAFVKAVDRQIGDVDKFILTGLHMLKRSYDDGVTYLDRLKEVMDHMERWRSMNPEMKVHFELADIQDPLIRRDVVKMACDVADSVGLNEDELGAVTGRPSLPGIDDIAESMERFLSSYPVGKVLLHSKDFVAAMTTDGYYADPLTVRDSMMVGVLSSQWRAYSGQFGTIEDLRSLLASGAVSPSSQGLEAYSSFESSRGVEEAGIARQGRGVDFLFIPCLLSEVTRNTVGLGDCLTAGSVLSEIR